MITSRDVRPLAVAVIAFVLAGCGSDGDIKISADNNSTVNNPPSGGGGSNPCASYIPQGGSAAMQGSYDGTNCTYSSSFVGKNNPMLVDLTIPFISGVHIFQDALIMGESVITDGAPAPTGGDGPTLTIEPGNTLAWSDSTDFLLINRGSQIIADGSPAAPITLTGFLDAVAGTADPEAVQLWGGMVMNGNGIVNSCSDQQRTDFTCNELSEGGVDARYGGNDNGESSGILRYVVVKHTGFEVAPGDELNGITFNAIGSGTVVENIEAYSTYDDGIEFFGGAVNVTNYVALYIRDDAIDYANGFVGSVTNALVIDSGVNRSGRCIEADNDGSAFDLVPLTNPVVSHMTCITSGIDGTGGFDDSEGPLLRRGVASRIADSIVWDGYLGMGATAGNECFEVVDAQTLEHAQDGTSTVKSMVISCNTPTQGGPLPNGDTVAQWVTNTGTAGSYPENTNNVIVTRTTNLSRALGGSTCFYSEELLDADDNVIGSTFLDDTGASFDVLSEGGGVVGAVGPTNDWTANWTFGLGPELWIRGNSNCGF